MKTKFFTLLLALAASVGTLLASNTIGGISYNLYKSTLTAEVTYNGSSYIKNTYSGAINIPSTVYHSENGKLYTYTVTSIGDNAFRSSTGLTSVTIPNSVTTIGSNAFLDCSKLTSINVNTNNAYYISNNGVLFNKAMTLLKQYPAGKTGNYTIPSSVSIIEERAFTGCRNLTSVTIGNSVTSIGNSAFSGCSGLQSIKIPNSLTKIGDKVFIGCSGLISITIGNSVTSIGDSAFSGCSGLTSISIPNCVTSIGLYAFHYCSGLTSVNIGNGVTTIAISAFSDCTNLTSVTIGSNVTYIGLDAFYKCNNLTSVTLNSNSLVSKSYTSNSNISTIFGNNVTEYNIGDGIANIGSNAFSGCSAMNSITIPNSVTNIGEGAFSNCSGLTSVTIPNSVTSIGEGAFFGCTGLTSLTIGNSVTSIGKEAFYDCSGLTSIEIPNSVTSIGDDAFYNCSGLTSVTIGNSVTSIGDDAFYNCSGLTSIEIPNSVTSIGEYAFWGCSGLTSIDVAADNINYCSVEGVLFNKDQTSLIKYPGGKQGAYIIPNSVTSIGSDAFRNCSGLTSVTIGNSVTSIGDFAFWYCSGLTSVTIPNSVTSIGHLAFAECTGFTSITIPNSVTSIGNNAFWYCSGLTSIDVASDNSNYCSVDGVLFNKDKTTLIQYPGGKQGAYTIPNSVTSIGDGAFAECTGLTSVTIPNSVTSIGSDAFRNCSGLTSVTIGNSVTSIGDFAFWYCSGLTYVTIPNSVTSIGWWAFEHCTGLTSVTIEAETPPTLGNYAFELSGSGFDIYVPCGTLEAYKTAWADYASRIKYGPLEYQITGNVNIEGAGSVQLPQNMCEDVISATPNNGYHFTQWSDGLKENPRTIELTQDTTFTAEFAPDRVGTCGKDLALVWSYDPTNKVLTIGNAGSFTENMQFGLEAPNEMEELVIGNSVTAIGTNAFAGIETLKKVSIGESVKTIGEQAFYNCVNLETIFNYRPTPTNTYSNAFDGVDKFECALYVLPSSIDMYKAAAVWRDFYYTYAIGAEEATVTTNDVTVEPQDNAATVTWPTNDNAATYTIQISKDGVVFCTLIFNANGQLTGIAFAPSRDGQAHAPQAIMTANGMQFTVTGLDSSTHYALTLQAKDSQESVLASYSSEFTTTGQNASQGLDEISSSLQGGDRGRLILHDGQIFILRGDKTYTLTGQEVK